MSISTKVRKALTTSSVIRRLFEDGISLKKKYGEDKVYDFSLGNPQYEPPIFVREALQDLTTNPPAGLHLYMPTAGHFSTRKSIASYLSKRDALEVKHNDIIMCTGAAGGLNVVGKSILNPDDEVIIIAPYFVEYLHYVRNFSATPILCQSNPDFSLNTSNLEACITPRTKALLLNSPNNPTGVIYPDDTLQEVSELLQHKQKKYDKVIYLISDDIYQRIAYDGATCSAASKFYNNTIIVSSFSKDLALAGERIGYIYVSPLLKVDKIREALEYANRTMGYVNAPALMQRVVERVVAQPIDITFLQQKRDMLAEVLRTAGLQFTLPQGAFYFFLPVPAGNDVEFCQYMQTQFQIISVPGNAFGRDGYFRLSYCVPDKTIINSKQAWCDSIKAWRAKH